jgi:4-hydroxy-tetrahydrodipicolinate synthase
MFKGSMPALVTPFKDGAVDFDTLKRLVEWHIEQGSTGLVPVGTTGESPTLSHAEHEAVIETVVTAVNGRIPVIAGAGSNNTAEAIHFAQHAQRVGADAVLIVSPYYNKPTQRGLVAHFTAVHEATDIPIVVYNIPGRSSVDILPATMAEIAKLPRVVAVKDATGDLARICAERRLITNGFAFLSGEDATAHGYNAQGGQGFISVTANVAPALCAQMQKACQDGDFVGALALQDKLMPLHHAIFAEPGLCGAKYALSRLGLCENEVRLPLLPVLEETQAKIDDALRSLGLID